MAPFGELALFRRVAPQPGEGSAQIAGYGLPGDAKNPRRLFLGVAVVQQAHGHPLSPGEHVDVSKIAGQGPPLSHGHIIPCSTEMRSAPIGVIPACGCKNTCIPRRLCKASALRLVPTRPWAHHFVPAWHELRSG